MGWTLTSVAARVLGPLGWGRRWVAPDAVSNPVQRRLLGFIAAKAAT